MYQVLAGIDNRWSLSLSKYSVNVGRRLQPQDCPRVDVRRIVQMKGNDDSSSLAGTIDRLHIMFAK